MIPLKTYQQPSSFISIAKPNQIHTVSLQHKFLSLTFPSTSPPPKFPLKLKPTFSLFSRSFPLLRVSKIGVQICSNEEHEGEEDKPELHDLSPNGPVYQKTLQLVECSMFAALTGLVYFLSNSLAIEVCQFQYKNWIFSFYIGLIKKVEWWVCFFLLKLVSFTKNWIFNWLRKYNTGFFFFCFMGWELVS